MINRLRSISALGVLTIGLAACGNDVSTPTTPVVVPPAPVATTESMFGTCFATDFDASPNSKPNDPSPCSDLPPVSPTTKPTPI